MGNKRERDGFLEYASRVHRARLDTRCKVLLWHYAYAFNWLQKKPSFYSQNQICLITGMSPSTYQKSRKRLIELGWIIEQKVHGFHPVLVTPRIGRDDESFVAPKGVDENEKITLEEALMLLPNEFFDPFMEQDKFAS